MMKFIKLTDAHAAQFASAEIWVNFSHVELMRQHTYDGKSLTELVGVGFVKETPEQIMEMMSRVPQA